MLAGQHGRPEPHAEQQSRERPTIPEWRREVVLDHLSTALAVGIYWLSYTLLGYVPRPHVTRFSAETFPDEFDVFMDAVNRRISMKMMVCDVSPFMPGRF